jgi:phosphoribosylanthranilate isomerase
MVVSAKICGLTRPEDAALAVAHGATRLGVVFASGPRVISPARAREIVAAAGAVPVLGVVGPAPVEAILELARAAALGGVQLHGDHEPDVASALRTAGLEVWRVVPVGPATALTVVLPAAISNVDAVVIEAQVPGGSGGKGIPVALALARAAREAVGTARFVLSGGLNPDRVAEAIEVVRPDMVDVSSGVESSPGIKDRDRLVRFLEIVRAAHLAR